MNVEVQGFDWDDGNRDKCRKHGMSAVLIEELFLRNALRVEPDVRNSAVEKRYRAIGKTREGRGVFLVFTLRVRGGNTLIRPISARYMHKKEIDCYEKENP